MEDRCHVCDETDCKWWNNVVDGRRAIGSTTHDECRARAVNWRERCLEAETENDLTQRMFVESKSWIQSAQEELRKRAEEIERLKASA